MTDASRAAADPFAVTVRGVGEPHPARAALRAAGPIVRAEAQLHYLIFTLIYAGQLTTDPSLGFLLARVFDVDRDTAAETTIEEFVR
ncbi:hypothetical protein SAMN05216275_102231 [Streptosporangium canum]|uniref:Uncharacterized protein n=1 Tax=Streptosporangium canum TaxID=324952 RepID=A0A1I3GV71_9ACTN|nr:hypothetical protein [Streptosporangium canum]SFI27276.1 hypothetical protein SAMN05216275_102231 [Streptosporangium canum]